MQKPDRNAIVMLVCGWIALSVLATATADEGPTKTFGQHATKDQIAAWNITIFPDGRNLPAGKGDHAAGKLIYAQRCAFCHGLTLNATRLKIDPGGKRIKNFETNGAPALLGQPAPAKTVQNYWPYATTLFDYIRRAMPFYEPGHLSNDEVYALCAFILGEAGIIGKDEEMSSKTLYTVQMPNRNGFIDGSQKQ